LTIQLGITYNIPIIVTIGASVRTRKTVAIIVHPT